MLCGILTVVIHGTCKSMFNGTFVFETHRKYIIKEKLYKNKMSRRGYNFMKQQNVHETHEITKMDPIRLI